MSKGFPFALGSGALWGALLVLPLWLTDFSAPDITFGRFLVFSVFVLGMVLLYRRDSLRHLGNGRVWQFQQIALFGNLFFYLALIASIKHIGAVPACILVGVLPVISWKSVNSGFQPKKEFLLVLFLMSFSLLFAVASQEKPVSHEVNDTWLQGVMLLLIAGICWLYSSSLQSRMVRKHPEIDRSDHFLLTGTLIFPGLLLMSLLASLSGSFLEISADSDFGLFTSDHSFERHRFFWVCMFCLALLGTLLARLMWEKFVQRESDAVLYWQSSLKSAFGLLYVFLIEGRWPNTLEAVALGCFILGMMVYGRQRSENPCLKA